MLLYGLLPVTNIFSRHFSPPGDAAVDAHMAPSTLSGGVADAVHAFRQQCLREFHDAVALCSKHGVALSDDLLKRGAYACVCLCVCVCVSVCLCVCYSNLGRLQTCVVRTKVTMHVSFNKTTTDKPRGQFEKSSLSDSIIFRSRMSTRVYKRADLRPAVLVSQ